MNYDTIFHFSHGDLDGVACTILSKRKFGDSSKIIVELCDYDNINSKLIEFCSREHFSVDDLLLITDICPNSEVCEQIDKIRDEISVVLIDHHKTKKWVSKYPWAHFNPYICGALGTLEWLGLEEEAALEFSRAVNAWDMWLTDSNHRERGENLNSLVSFIGLHEFRKSMQNSKNLDEDLTRFKDLIFYINKNKKHYVRKVIKEQLGKAQCMMDGLGKTFKILFATDFISEVGYEALNHPESADLHYVVIINPVKNTCSLRSRGNEVDVGEIAKKLGGGGHSSASGFIYNFKKKIGSTIHNLLLNKLN